MGGGAGLLAFWWEEAGRKDGGRCVWTLVSCVWGFRMADCCCCCWEVGSISTQVEHVQVRMRDAILGGATTRDDP